LLFRISDPELLTKQRLFLETKEEHNLAKIEHERKKELNLNKVVTDSELAEANSLFNLLTARLKGQRIELRSIGINIEKLENELTFQNSIPVYSPTNGVVSNVFVNKGQMVQPEDKLMDIANNKDTKLLIQVLARDVPLLEKGQQVSFSLPRSEKTLNAKISKISPTLDTEKGTLHVFCDIAETDCSAVIPGMFVNAEILAGSKKTKALSNQAYMKEGKQLYGYLVKDDHLEKISLDDYQVYQNYLLLPDSFDSEMVIEGAYYIE